MTPSRTYHKGKLVNDEARRRAAQACLSAPDGHVMKIMAPTRSLEQNAALWPRLRVIRQAKLPMRQHYTEEDWKAVFMKSIGEDPTVLHDLEGQPFYVYRSSELSSPKFSELLESVNAFIAQNGIEETQHRQAS